MSYISISSAGAGRVRSTLASRANNASNKQRTKATHSVPLDKSERCVQRADWTSDQLMMLCVCGCAWSVCVCVCVVGVCRCLLVMVCVFVGVCWCLVLVVVWGVGCVLCVS